VLAANPPREAPGDPVAGSLHGCPPSHIARVRAVLAGWPGRAARGTRWPGGGQLFGAARHL